MDNEIVDNMIAEIEEMLKETAGRNIIEATDIQDRLLDLLTMTRQLSEPEEAAS